MSSKRSLSRTSIKKEVLLALIPYTRQNFMLTFKPNSFFDELDRISKIPPDKSRRTYRSLVRQGMVINNGKYIELSLEARQIVQPFVAEKLSNDAILMVIFDIPEERACTRQRFRYLLRQLDFKQIQLSVWSSDKDHRSLLSESVENFELQDYVQIYEAVRIS